MVYGRIYAYFHRISSFVLDFTGRTTAKARSQAMLRPGDELYKLVLWPADMEMRPAPRTREPPAI